MKLEEGTFGGNSSKELDPRANKQPGPRGATVEPRTMSAPSAKSSRKENSNHGGGDESSGKLQERRFLSAVAMFTGPVMVPVAEWSQVEMVLINNGCAASASTPPAAPGCQCCCSGLC